MLDSNDMVWLSVVKVKHCFSPPFVFEPLIVTRLILFDQCLEQSSRHVCISFSVLTLPSLFFLRLSCTCVKCNINATTQATQRVVERLYYIHFPLLWFSPSLLTGVRVSSFDASGR